MNNLDISAAKRTIQRLGKGGKAIRWGQKTFIGTKDKTPQGIVTANFKRSLETFNVDSSSITLYSNEVGNMERARFMNMKILAATYAMMKKYNISSYDDLRNSRQYFETPLIIEFIRPSIVTRAGTAKVEDDERTMLGKIVSFKQEILRYMMAILYHRMSGNEIEFEEIAPTLEDQSDIFDVEDEAPDEVVVTNVFDIPETY